MRAKYMVITGALSLVVLGGVVFHDSLFPRRGETAAAGRAAQAAREAVPAKVPSASAQGDLAAVENEDQTRPAWMNPPATAGQPHAPLSSSADARADDERAVRMRAAMNRLERLQAQKNVDPQAVDEALAEVERAHGSSVLQGVRLDVLRENLKVAARMQKVAAELQDLQRRSASGDMKPAQQAELNKKLAEMEAMQRELRMDFFVGNPAPVRP
ncbi:MAG: hypothetical protein AB7S86_15650 [Hydrogenophaga sp.]|uniref:hypothetical protein n=1 Tax=Hydrogenophaga sp. TaxID=1904254 RepID=UPI003D12E769